MRRQPASLAWKPSEFESPNEIVERFCSYTDRKRAFVVFSHGTVVFSDAEAARSDTDYVATLVQVTEDPPDFTVVPTKDSNFLIRFRGPVCGYVSRDFFCRHASAIRHELDVGGIFPCETLKLVHESSDAEEHYYVGLFARAKLFADVGSPFIAERFQTWK